MDGRKKERQERHGHQCPHRPVGKPDLRHSSHKDRNNVACLCIGGNSLSLKLRRCGRVSVMAIFQHLSWFRPLSMIISTAQVRWYTVVPPILVGAPAAFRRVVVAPDTRVGRARSLKKLRVESRQQGRNPRSLIVARKWQQFGDNSSAIHVVEILVEYRVVARTDFRNDLLPTGNQVVKTALANAR